MKSENIILIVASHSHLLQGLEALLAVIPDVQVIVRDSLSTEKNTNDYQTLSLVILDYESVKNDLLVYLDQMRNNWKHARWIMLIDDEQQRLEVMKAGIDRVLVKGFAADKLLINIKDLLST